MCTEKFDKFFDEFDFFDSVLLYIDNDSRWAGSLFYLPLPLINFSKPIPTNYLSTDLPFDILFRFHSKEFMVLIYDWWNFNSYIIPLQNQLKNYIFVGQKGYNKNFQKEEGGGDSRRRKFT